MREVAKFARRPDWTLEKALALLPAGGAVHLREAADRYEAQMRPLKAVDPKLDGAITREVADAFAPIGAKMRPDMSIEQAGFWTSAIVLSLSDLPPFVARSALQEAVHVPYDFPTDMEKGVRAIAQRKLEEHRTAIRRLRAMLEAIHRAANPVAQITDEQHTDEPMSLDEIRKTPVWVRKLGVGTGAIRPEDLETVEREEAERGE